MASLSSLRSATSSRGSEKSSTLDKSNQWSGNASAIELGQIYSNLNSFLPIGSCASCHNKPKALVMAAIPVFPNQQTCANLVETERIDGLTGMVLVIV